jgi:hypothetical protein
MVSRKPCAFGKVVPRFTRKPRKMSWVEWEKERRLDQVTVVKERS